MKYSCLLTVFDFLLRFMYYDSLIQEFAPNLPMPHICPALGADQAAVCVVVFTSTSRHVSG